MMSCCVFRRYFYLIVCLVLAGNNSYILRRSIPTVLFDNQTPSNLLSNTRQSDKHEFLSNERKQTRLSFALHARKRFTLGEREIIISCVVSKFSNPSSTRLVPPITWLTSSGSRVKVLHSVSDPTPKSSAPWSRTSSNNNDGFDGFEGSSRSTIERQQTAPQITPRKNGVVQSSVLEISVPRKRVDETLMNLRVNGFKKQDIYRMLDKGPWTLAFDLPGPLSKLLSDLENDLGLNQTQSVHIISHCPYLLAQYSCYRGRDVWATARALLEVGYSAAHLTEDVMRFPSILAAPPGRINGWLSLLQAFGIATQPGTFAKLLQRAPFLFYIDPPQLFDIALGPAKLFRDTDEFRDQALRSANQALKSNTIGFVNKPVFSKNKYKNAGSVRENSYLPTSTTQQRISGETEDANSEDLITFESLKLNKLAHSHQNVENTRSLEAPTDRLNESGSTQQSSIVQDKLSPTGSTAWVTGASTGRATAEAQKEGRELSSQGLSVSTTDGYVFENVVHVFHALQSFGVTDLDKVVRSQPRILLESESEVSARLLFLCDFFIDAATAATPYTVSAPVVETVTSSASAVAYASSTTRQAPVAATSASLLDVAELSDEWLDAVYRKTIAGLNSLLLAYPYMLAIEHKNLVDVSSVLRSVGFRRHETLQLMKKQPSVFRTGGEDIQLVVSFLRYYCGFKKFELVAYILKYPTILESKVTDLTTKVDFLYETLGGDPAMLKETPSYLHYDLDQHVRLRVDFLQAVGFRPLHFGLEFLLTASVKDFAAAARIDEALFDKFRRVYFDKLKTETKAKKALMKLQMMQAQDQGQAQLEDVDERPSVYTYKSPQATVDRADVDSMIDSSSSDRGTFGLGKPFFKAVRVHRILPAVSTNPATTRAAAADAVSSTSGYVTVFDSDDEGSNPLDILFELSED